MVPSRYQYQPIDYFFFKLFRREISESFQTNNIVFTYICCMRFCFIVRLTVSYVVTVNLLISKKNTVNAIQFKFYIAVQTIKDIFIKLKAIQTKFAG